MRKNNRFISAARNYLRYSLSLPERTIRSLAAIAGGASTLVTKTILPKALRKTSIYKVSFGMMQRFIVERVAGIERELGEEPQELDDDYLLRKMAGTALEAAGLFAMRFSPLWVFAIAGDAAGGSKVFLERLVWHLKTNDVIARDTKASELVDVLEAIQEASGKSAASIDAPPLSREKLTELVDDMKVNYSRVFKTTANLMPRLDTIWKNMEELSKRENVSIERLGGMIAVDALSLRKKGLGILQSTGRTGAELFDEKILESYRNTLSSMSDKGIDKYMSSHMKPFMKAARSHFDPEHKTWLESLSAKRRKN